MDKFGTVHVVHRLIKLPLTLKKRPASYFISFIYKQFFFFFLNSENQNCNASTVSQLASVRKVKNKSSFGKISQEITHKRNGEGTALQSQNRGKDSGLPTPQRKRKTLPAGQLDSVMACKGESVVEEKRGNV